MSEIKLNLTDTRHIIHGKIHGSIADAAIAALSAEPETIAELETALARYNKPITTIGPFAWFHERGEIDTRPWDAGIVIIDLAARIVASESTYSQPGPQGEVRYHDGVSATDITVLYRVPDDWLFLNSIAEYEGMRDERLQQRLATPPLDARAILYGRALLEFISRECLALNYDPASGPAPPELLSATPDGASPLGCHTPWDNDPSETSVVAPTSSMLSAESIVLTGGFPPDADDPSKHDAIQEAIAREVSTLHARWLMTPLDDLRGQSPREVLLARQDFIDYELHTRELQWSLQSEGPPCLATDSFAYRFAGFGTHEWVVYYDLVRCLLWCAATLRRFCHGDLPAQLKAVELVAMTTRLEELKTEWLEQAQPDYDDRIPALIIENERRRLPIAMLGRDMVIDEDCPVCQMMGAETGLGLEVGFWHLDGCNMDDDFAFSSFRTLEEWEADRRQWEEFNEKFNREWEERHQQERQEPSP